MIASDVISAEIRVLVVDDSAVVRTVLSNMLQSDPRIRVCGTARNGEEAIDKAKLLQPDVITLDVEMPVLDGIGALKRIMSERPCPVIMVSRMTHEGAEVTVDALSSGAFDYLPKEDLQNKDDAQRLQQSLVEKIEAAANSCFALRRVHEPAPSIPLREGTRVGASTSVVPKIAVIGTSTGGPRALQQILPELPQSLPIPVVVVQHMPPGFTAPLAKRLNTLSKVNICEAKDGDQLKPGTVYIAPAGQHTMLFGSHPKVWFSLSDMPNDTMHKPSVDVTMRSIAEVFGRNVLGIILTGMGNDGAQGMQAIQDAGGITIGQDQATSAVYGMPRCCAETGVLQRVVPLAEVPNLIIEAVRYKP